MQESAPILTSGIPSWRILKMVSRSPYVTRSQCNDKFRCNAKSIALEKKPDYKSMGCVRCFGGARSRDAGLKFCAVGLQNVAVGWRIQAPEVKLRRRKQRLDLINSGLCATYRTNPRWNRCRNDNKRDTSTWDILHSKNRRFLQLYYRPVFWCFCDISFVSACK